MTRQAVTVTSGGRGLGAEDWRPRLDGLTADDGPEAAARRAARRVRCPLCGGQATADRGRVFIAHRPRCPRSAPGPSSAASSRTAARPVTAGTRTRTPRPMAAGPGSGTLEAAAPADADTSGGA